MCMFSTPCKPFFVPVEKARERITKNLTQEVPMCTHPVYPTGRAVSQELRKSMRAARLVALRATRDCPKKNRHQRLSEIQLASLLASLERMIALLEDY